MFIASHDEGPAFQPTTEDSDLYVVLEYKLAKAYTRAYALLTIQDIDGHLSGCNERRYSADVSPKGAVHLLGELPRHESGKSCMT